MFIARRLVILAAEDIGMADPQALSVAVATQQAVHFIGMPEGRIPLAEATVYLATAPKSNTAYMALNRALEDVQKTRKRPRAHSPTQRRHRPDERHGLRQRLQIRSRPRRPLREDAKTCPTHSKTDATTRPAIRVMSSRWPNGCSSGGVRITRRLKGLDQTSGCHSSRKSLSYLQQARTITRLRNKSSQLGLRCFDVADRTPLAFMSYAHSDDRHDEGRLTQLRERLSGEVGMQTGKDFPIFQDRKDIKWGQAWKERIEQSLIEVTFLIPIITPGFFTSDFCRDELQIFIEREKELKRSDLILPIYYVNTPLLHDENRRGSDELAQLIAARQYADWRDLRLQPFTLPLVGKTLEQLALQIRDALERVSADAEESSKNSSRKETARAAKPNP